MADEQPPRSAGMGANASAARIIESLRHSLTWSLVIFMVRYWAKKDETLQSELVNFFTAWLTQTKGDIEQANTATAERFGAQPEAESLRRVQAMLFTQQTEAAQKVHDTARQLILG